MPIHGRNFIFEISYAKMSLGREGVGFHLLMHRKVYYVILR